MKKLLVKAATGMLVLIAAAASAAEPKRSA